MFHILLSGLHLVVVVVGGNTHRIPPQTWKGSLMSRAHGHSLFCVCKPHSPPNDEGTYENCVLCKLLYFVATHFHFQTMSSHCAPTPGMRTVMGTVASALITR